MEIDFGVSAGCSVKNGACQIRVEWLHDDHEIECFLPKIGDSSGLFFILEEALVKA